MSNFRKNERHKLEKGNFSIGSIITAGHDYIVVETSKDRVGLLCTKTWKVILDKNNLGVLVVDPHWLTYVEAGDVAGLTGLNWTRSDFDYRNEGLKT